MKKFTLLLTESEIMHIIACIVSTSFDDPRDEESKVERAKLVEKIHSQASSQLGTDTNLN